MVKFIAIKVHYDDRYLAPELKYAVPADVVEYQRYLDRSSKKTKAGLGFHECLNFEKVEGEPVRMYLPPTGIPTEADEEYVIFSFTYQSDPSVGPAVVGVHGTARVVNKSGVARPGVRRLPGVDEFTYHVEADADFVTLFSEPLPYDRREGLYTDKYERWGNGLRYLTTSQAANILDAALVQAEKDLRGSGSESYRRFVEREIDVIENLRARYDLHNARISTRTRGNRGGRRGASLPDKELGKRGEQFIFEREVKAAVERGFKREQVSWAAQSIPNLPYDIETVRGEPEKSRPHFIEVKSTTVADFSNIYISQQQIDYMREKRGACSFVVLLFGLDGEMQDEREFDSVDELLAAFELQPIKFKLRPKIGR